MDQIKIYFHNTFFNNPKYLVSIVFEKSLKVFLKNETKVRLCHYAVFFYLISLIATGHQQHRTLDWASCFKSDQVLFRFLHSLSTVRLHVSQSLPFLFPIPSRRCHCIACRATEYQPHLCLLMITH